MLIFAPARTRQQQQMGGKVSKRRKPRVLEGATAASRWNTTKKAAIDDAEARVSGLRHIGSGRWGYHVWSSPDNAWIPSLQSEAYGDACRKRAGSIAALAAYSLLCNGSARYNEALAWRVMHLAYGPTTGNVRQRLKQILDAL
jgi:hypothetical protein